MLLIYKYTIKPNNSRLKKIKEKENGNELDEWEEVTQLWRKEEILIVFVDENVTQRTYSLLLLL